MSAPELELDQTYTPERMKLVLDSTRLGMWDWNPQTNALMFDKNWAEMLGVRVEDLSMNYDDWASRVHPEDLDQCLEDINNHIEGRTPFYENVHRMRHSDGSWVYILDRGMVTARDEQGRAVRFTGTHADLTPLKEAEFQASLAHKSKDRFFSSMSHELRAPLHAIIGILEQLQDAARPASESALLQTAVESSRFLGSLVDDILDVSKVASVGLTSVDTWFDLITFLETLHSLFERRFDEVGTLLKFDVDPSVLKSGLSVRTDKNRLQQILINLLSNALKYAAHDEVRMGLSSDGGNWIISVTDRGPGIADTEAIFEPFVSHNDAPEKIDGPNSTGLGLYVVRELVAVLGLDLEVFSKVGEGSRFEVIIPETQTHIGTRGSSSLPRVWPVPDLKHMRVLVVDDDGINRDVLKWRLSGAGAEVLEAENGLRALDMISGHEINLVISDLHMPEMGGIELTKAIRTMALTMQPKIIISSADAYESAWPICNEAGADHYLSKPFDSHDLYRTLGEIQPD